MRRIRAILALGAGLAVVAFPDLAGAHPFFDPFQIEVGAPVTLSLVVPSEFPVPTVDVVARMPVDFRVTGTSPPAGWAVDPEDPLHFSGQTAVGARTVFEIRGEAKDREPLHASVVVTASDGTRNDWASTNPRDRFPAALLLAGVNLEEAAVASEDGVDGSNETLRTVGLALIAGGLLLGGGFFALRGRFFAPAGS